MNAPVLFLPTLPEAKAIAKATWAKDPTAPKRSVELDETIREVSSLQDVWIGSLVKKWQVRSALIALSSKRCRCALRASSFGGEPEFG